MSGSWPPDFEDDLDRRRGEALFLTRNNLPLGRGLQTRFPELRFTLLTKNDLRGWGSRRLLGFLRSRPWEAMVLEDEAAELRRRRDLYRVLVLAARARTRWFLALEDGSIRGEHVPWVRGWRNALGALGGEGLATLRAWRDGWSTVGKLGGARPAPRTGSRSGRRVAFLRTEFWFGVRAGGSVSHALGVVNGMRTLGLEPRLWTTSRLPIGEDRLVQTLVAPGPRPALLEDAGMAAFTRTFVRSVEPELRAFRPDVVYHRHDVFSLAGLELARKLGIPLVLEVNSSEVWVRKNWSRLTWIRLAEAMERTAFRNADRLVLVSDELVPAVLAAGAERDRVVVNPNGVDVSRFDPADDGSAARQRLGFPRDTVVCGFLGTFTRWHGVLFLAEQIAPLARRNPQLRFLFLGDGDLRPQVEERLSRDGVLDRVRFTGLLEPSRIPEHLAGCDILLSPHLPFEDGTPFFGSPTKLFEYLAAGRPVVASRLGQIGRVVEHEETGLLFDPGNAEEFRSAVLRLAKEPDERRRMGARARSVVESRYTWEANVRRALLGILDLPAPVER